MNTMENETYTPKKLQPFRKMKSDFSEIKRDGNIALWLRMTAHGPSYEVVKVQTMKKDRVISGVVVGRSGDEYYPSCESFGRLGWHYSDIQSAERKFCELVEAQKSKISGDV